MASSATIQQVRRDVLQKVYEGASAIAAGDYQSYIIDSERKLYSCGKNTSGQLGINSTESMKKHTHMLWTV